MKQIHPAFLLILMLAGGALPAGAEQVNFSTGKTSASYLDIPLSARQTALAGACAGVDADLGAATSNPAGLNGLAAMQIMGVHGQWVQDIFFDSVTFGMPLSERSAGAASLMYVNFGTMEKYAVDAFDNPLEQGTFTPYALVLNAAYAYRVDSLTALGINLKGLLQQIDTVRAAAFAVDVGAMFYPGPGGWTIGAALTNLGTKPDAVSDLPSQFKIGSSYRWPVRWIGDDSLGFVAEGNVPLLASDTAFLALGAECVINRMIAVRAGYRLHADAGLGAGHGLSAGLGIRYAKLTLDFGLTSLGLLGETYQVGLSAGF